MRRWIARLLLAGLILAPNLGAAQTAAISNWPSSTTAASSLAVTALSGLNANVTATLPAVTNAFHYITGLRIVRTCTAAILGSAALSVTSTNLPGALAWTMGNACLIGTTNADVSEIFHNPLQSSAANTDTTITCPAVGLLGLCRITVYYFTAP